MFIGHVATAFMGKAAHPRPSLGTFVLAACWPDLVLPLFLLAGWERVRIAPGDTVVAPIALEHYPYSHSLLAVLLWALAFAGLYRLIRRDGRGALLLGALVLGHWVLDWISHRPDLLLYPGGSLRVGLGLWNSLAGTLIVEMGLFALGLAVYLHRSAARNRVGRWSLVGLVALLLALYAGSVFGPPPPSATAFAWSDLSAWLLVPWAWWIDANRTPVPPPATARGMARA